MMSNRATGIIQFIVGYNVDQRRELNLLLELCKMAGLGPTRVEGLEGNINRPTTRATDKDLVLGKRVAPSWLEGSWRGNNQRPIDNPVEDEEAEEMRTPIQTQSTTKSPRALASPIFQQGSDDNNRYRTKSWSWKREAQRQVPRFSSEATRINTGRESRLFDEGQPSGTQ